MKRYEITTEQWNRIKNMLPPEQTGKKGRPRKDNRIMLNGMLRIARSGCQWRELPECYGKWRGVYTRFRKWEADGTLERIFDALNSDADMENVSIDSTSIKVHESANGGVKRGN
ncbi:MAG: IS5 family transposase [Clostridiaceae bacterium]|nr:IS5 family transposase [Clostridiaceae bacterium]